MIKFCFISLLFLGTYVYHKTYWPGLLTGYLLAVMLIPIDHPKRK